MARPKIDAERKAQVLAALEKCVIRKGLAKTSLQDVANEAGLPRSLVRYFVGNRDEMVVKLFSSMIDRGESQLANIAPSKNDRTLDELLDFLFEGVFADDTSNALVNELWYLASRDSSIRSRLRNLYQRVCMGIERGLERENLGANDTERQNVAYALVALSYGHASFSMIKLVPPTETSVRDQAQAILSAIRQSN